MAVFYRLYVTNTSVISQNRWPIVWLQTQLSFKQENSCSIQVDHLLLEQSSQVLTLKTNLVKNQLGLIKFASEDVYVTSVKRSFNI